MFLEIRDRALCFLEHGSLRDVGDGMEGTGCLIIENSNKAKNSTHPSVGRGGPGRSEINER